MSLSVVDSEVEGIGVCPFLREWVSKTCKHFPLLICLAEKQEKSTLNKSTMADINLENLLRGGGNVQVCCAYWHTNFSGV